MDDATRERMIRRFEAEGWDAKPNFGGGITAIKKNQ
jgi:transposase